MCGRGRVSSLAHQRIRQYTARRRGSSSSADSGTASGASNSVKRGQDDCQDTNTGEEQQRNATEELPTIENMCPGMKCPVIVVDSDSQEKMMETMAWGLIPKYFPTDQKPDHYQLFNKRIESFDATSGKYFPQLLMKKRCLVILDGFYEWKVIAGQKQPYYIHFRNNEPLLIPGIYEDSQALDYRTGEPISFRSFALLTGDPCPAFTSIHTRQPIFLTKEQAEQWLDPTLSAWEDCLKLLKVLQGNCKQPSLPFNQVIHFYPVTRKVTDGHFQEEECTKAISLGQNMMTFFKKQDSNEASPADASTLSQQEAAQQKTATNKDDGHKGIDNVDLVEDDDDAATASKRKRVKDETKHNKDKQPATPNNVSNKMKSSPKILKKASAMLSSPSPEKKMDIAKFFQPKSCSK